MLAHRSTEDFDGLLGRMFIADHACLALPIDLPDRFVGVVAVVGRLAALFPAHHARLVMILPEGAAEDRGRLYPDDLLVIEELELLPDSLYQPEPSVCVPAVD